MRTVIRETQTGTRTITGTEWPVVDQVVRDQRAGRRPTWQVVRGLCNGVPDSCTEHSTRREALEALS